jgi:hypothetical protein
MGGGRLVINEFCGSCGGQLRVGERVFLSGWQIEAGHSRYSASIFCRLCALRPPYSHLTKQWEEYRPFPAPVELEYYEEIVKYPRYSTFNTESGFRRLRKPRKVVYHQWTPGATVKKATRFERFIERIRGFFK